MEDEQKTKGELLRELRDLRRQHANPEATHADTSRSPAYPSSGEAFFRSLIENALDIITVLDAKGSFLYQSPNIEQMLGYLPEELIGKSSFEYIHPEDRSGVIDALNYLVEKPGASVSAEYRFRAKDGSWLTFESVGKMLPSDATTAGVVVISRDVTDRKHAEAVQLQNERRLRRAEEVANFGNWELVVDEQVIHASDGARIIYGFGDKELQLADVQKVVLPEYRTILDKTLTDLISQGRPYDLEFKIRRPTDGRIVVIHSLAEYDPIQRTVFGVIQDITERKRADEELKLKSFTIDNLPEEVFWLTPDGRIWDVNDVACEKLGYTREELLSLSVADFDPIFPEESWQPFWKALKRSASLQFESLHKTKDGHVFPIEIMAKYFNYNNLEYDCAIVRDITQHKNLEKALQASEEQFRTLCDFAPIGIVRMDTEGRNLYSNPYLEKITGTTAAELMGEGWLKLIHPDDLNKVTEKVIETTTSKSLFSTEHRIVTPQGKTLWVRALGTPINSPEGSFLGHVGTVEDITDRKQAEEALRIAEKTFRDLLETIQLVAILLDREGSITFCNDYLLHLTGWEQEEVFGRNWFDVFIPHEEKEKMKKVFTSVITGEKVHSHYENCIVARNGRGFLISWNNTVLHDLEGKISGTASIGIDITERKNLEAQLRQAQKMEAVGQLAGGIAHDFNNILSAIVGYAYLLQARMGINDPSRDDVEQILESAHRAAEVTHSLLAFSKKQSINTTPVLINDVVKRSEKLLSRVIGENITINTSFSGDEVECMADAAQIEQVLMNLATNARDAMPLGGRLTFSTACVEMDQSFIRDHGYGRMGMFALISVSDTGIGMSKETAAKIFEPFFTTKETGKGTGLGLAMAYGIVKQHDGYIEVHSELGKGTTFNIYLPAAESKGGATAATIESSLSGGTETILVAEDNEKLRKLSEIILKQHGYKVILAEDGEDSIEKFIENKDIIHLVLLDMIMPKKSGKEVYDEIKRIKPNVKVIFVSGYTADRIDNESMVGENVDFLFKPVLPKDLLRKIRDMLAR